MVLIVGVVQVILRPEITMVPYAHEVMFWFILIHDSESCTGCSLIWWIVYEGCEWINKESITPSKRRNYPM